MRCDPFRFRQAGVTLIEMIVVIVVSGILMSLVGMFIRNQVDSYTDVANRTEIVDAVDGTLRRMARDLQRSLPNSVRVPGNTCVEFIPTRSGGRYRAEGGGANAVLDFLAADTSFNIYGPPSDVAVGDLIAVYNLGIPGADAFAGNNTSSVVAPAPALDAGTPVAAPETRITINSTLFPLASPSNRFHVIAGGEQVVSYVCTGIGVSAAGDGQGTLFRYVRDLPYAAPAACPAVPANAVSLAGNISACNFSYTPGVLQRSGLVEITLEIQRAHEPVALREFVNVANTP